MTGKAEAVAVLRRLGLDRTPTAVYEPPARLDPVALRRDLGRSDRYVARTSAVNAALNLPRLVDATAHEVCEWAARLDPGFGVIVQPYGELAFCGQLAVYRDRLLVEVVSGLWEMSAAQQPFRLAGVWATPERIRWTDASAPVDPQPCTWLYEADARSGHVEDWMISATQRWIETSVPALQELLRIEQNSAYGLKFHYTDVSGIAAQNLYADVPPSTGTEESALPEDCPVIRDVRAHVPDTEHVLLEVSVCREEAGLFDDLVSRLRRAGVRRVYLRSGVLSHAAIRLREASLDVRAAE